MGFEADGVTPQGLHYGNFAALLAGAIQELDVKVEPLTSLDLANDHSLGSMIRSFMENAMNGIRTIFADKVQTKELCIEDVCVTKDQLQNLLNQSGGNTGGSTGGTSGDTSGGGDTLPTTDPVVTDPGTTDPTLTDPAVTDPAPVDPAPDITAPGNSENSNAGGNGN